MFGQIQNKRSKTFRLRLTEFVMVEPDQVVVVGRVGGEQDRTGLGRRPLLIGCFPPTGAQTAG